MRSFTQYSSSPLPPLPKRTEAVSDDSDYDGDSSYSDSNGSCPSSPEEYFEKSGKKWDQKEWNQFVEAMLEWLNSENPTDPRVFTKDRVVISGNFKGILCYIFKGKFLPSAKADGLYWRPSQGATPTGKRMLKRYFYSRTKSGNRIKRQISTLEGFEDAWCVADYRVEHSGPTYSEQIRTAPYNDWDLIVAKVQEFKKNPSFAKVNIKPSAVPKSSSPSSKKRKQIEETNNAREFSNIATRAKLYLNPVPQNPFSTSSQMYAHPHANLEFETDREDHYFSSSSESEGNSSGEELRGEQMKTEQDLKDIQNFPQFGASFGMNGHPSSIPYLSLDQNAVKPQLPEVGGWDQLFISQSEWNTLLMMDDMNHSNLSAPSNDTPFEELKDRLAVY